VTLTRCKVVKGMSDLFGATKGAPPRGKEEKKKKRAAPQYSVRRKKGKAKQGRKLHPTSHPGGVGGGGRMKLVEQNEWKSSRLFREKTRGQKQTWGT